MAAAFEPPVSPMTVLRWERGDVTPRPPHDRAYREVLAALSSEAA
jgi:hypothetical protein